MDERQLELGRPPSLLPFDSLLLPYPVDPVWRRRIAEAHSTRYTETSTTPTSRDDRKRGTRRQNGTYEQELDARTDADESLERGVRGNRGGVTLKHDLGRRSIMGPGGARPLNIGFIGHDFNEHPTAHMMEGVFVWQKRLREIERTREGTAGALETDVEGRLERVRIKNGTGSSTPTNCCR